MYRSIGCRSLIFEMAFRTEITRLDEAIEEVSDPSEARCELLREHLESARTYLLGAMPAENSISLRLANEALDCIANADRRRRVREAIATMLAEEQ